MCGERRAVTQQHPFGFLHWFSPPLSERMNKFHLSVHPYIGGGQRAPLQSYIIQRQIKGQSMPNILAPLFEYLFFLGGGSSVVVGPTPQLHSLNSWEEEEEEVIEDGDISHKLVGGHNYNSAFASSSIHLHTHPYIHTSIRLYVHPSSVPCQIILLSISVHIPLKGNSSDSYIFIYLCVAG